MQSHDLDEISTWLLILQWDLHSITSSLCYMSSLLRKLSIGSSYLLCKLMLPLVRALCFLRTSYCASFLFCKLLFWFSLICPTFKIFLTSVLLTILLKIYYLGPLLAVLLSLSTGMWLTFPISSSWYYYFVKHCPTNFLFIDHIARENHLALIRRACSKRPAKVIALTKILTPIWHL